MYAKIIKTVGTWRDVADSARTTIGKEAGRSEVPSTWKIRMLLSEHSPIRRLRINWKWKQLPYWVSTHFVRHKVGIEHWVRTQRTDRTGIDRNEIGQGAEVEHEVEATAQAIITTSRKRLCMQTSRETRMAWQVFLDELKEVEPELVRCCVPDCVYRGHCYEYNTCGYHKSPQFKKALESYREGINE